MRVAKPLPNSSQTGFSLPELLVGAVIGLLAVTVIATVFSASEGQKRTASSGSDAMQSGALALYTIERDSRMSGYGITSEPKTLSCPVKMRFNASATITIPNLGPVIITQNATDTTLPVSIQLFSSTKTSFALPARINRTYDAAHATEICTDQALGFENNDLILIVPQSPSATNWCSVAQVTNAHQPAGGACTTHVMTNTNTVTGPPLNSQAHWNPPVMPAGNFLLNDYIINLGTFLNRTYSIDTTTTSNTYLNLLQSNLNTDTGATDTPLALFPQIVNLQAQYNKDTTATVASPATTVNACNTTTPTTSDEWRQIMSIKLALVARSSQYEREIVTTAAPTWTDCQGNVNNFNISWACPATETTCWQHYRYRVFETTTPLRNLTWKQ